MPRLTLIKACVIFSAVVLSAAGVSFGNSVTFGSLGPVNIGYTSGNGLTSTDNSANTLMTTASGSLAGQKFTEVVMTLTGFAPSGAATTIPMGGSGELIIQDLGFGSFTLSAGGQTLLSGTVSNSYLQLFGTAGSAPSSGSFNNSGAVSYTGGSLAVLIAANQLQETGDFSFGLVGFTGSFGTSLNGGYQQLNGFTSTASGLFDANSVVAGRENPNVQPTTVPLPTSVLMGLSMLGGLGVIGVFRRRSTTF